jgi:glycine cleavage system H lipoate-binding protein
MSTVLRNARRFFAPAQHLWFRTLQQDSTTSTSSLPQLWHVQIGMTERGLDHLGDITAVNIVQPERKEKSAGEDLLHLNWEGYEWTEADELYHTVWNSVEGVETLVSPVSGQVVASVDVEKEGVYDDTVLVELACHETDLEAAMKTLVDEQSYNKIVLQQVAGKFADA